MTTGAKLQNPSPLSHEQREALARIEAALIEIARVRALILAGERPIVSDTWLQLTAATLDDSTFALLRASRCDREPQNQWIWGQCKDRKLDEERQASFLA